MKGFVKVFLIILVVAIVGTLLVCGVCGIAGVSIQNQFKQQLKEATPQQMEQTSKSIADYTMTQGYSLKKSFDIMGVKAAIFNYDKNNQFLVMAQPPEWLVKINESNFKSSLTPQQIQSMIDQSQQKSTRIKDIKILQEGTLPTATKEVPYVLAKVTIEDTRYNRTAEFEGVVSVIDFTNPKRSIIILSGNPPTAFDIAATKTFIKTIKVN